MEIVRSMCANPLSFSRSIYFHLLTFEVELSSYATKQKRPSGKERKLHDGFGTNIWKIKKKKILLQNSWIVTEILQLRIAS